MIHAYLFVTDNNDNHDGHGPEFHKHMYRINKATGTKSLFYLHGGILIPFLSDHLENSEQFPLYHNNHCPTDNQPYDCKTFGWDVLPVHGNELRLLIGKCIHTRGRKGRRVGSGSWENFHLYCLLESWSLVPGKRQNNTFTI